ncbi:hypothetical protein MMC17_000856 [Xylographa soralifera]|nr:hypothetical protein [Xylographa soralifera]
MPTPAFFKEHPPFPDNIPVLPLPRLSYAKLLSNNSAESQALYNASTEQGFFLLDLSEAPEGPGLLTDTETVFGVGRAFFDLDLEEKKRYKANPGNVGYKPMGVMALADGKRDLTEICAVGQDSILNSSLATIPAVFDDERPLLKSLIRRLHPIAALLLSRLAFHLEVPYLKLAALHDPAQHSSTVLRFIHNPPQPDVQSRQASLLGHTDSGSITILFAAMGGLQILPADKADLPANWRWVRPEPNCAIVNIGDTMVQWTGGILRSSFHRVLYAPGAQAFHERYSFGYFLKPAGQASMKRFRDGAVIPKLRFEEEEEEKSMALYDMWHRDKTKGIIQGKNNVKSRGGAASKMQVMPRETFV